MSNTTQSGTPPRLRNYFLARNRHHEWEEVDWLRVSGFGTMTPPRPIVLVNGAFDVLHSGHMKIISAARDKARTLVCALDSDERVRQAKGPGRPIQSWIERATTLGYMPIDCLVEIASDVEMRKLIKFLKPDLRVQGYDYRNVPSKFPEIKKMFVRNSGMRTSEIVKRIIKDYEFTKRSELSGEHQQVS